MPRQGRPVLKWMRRRVDEALSDPRPNIPARKVFKRLRAYHARQSKRCCAPNSERVVRAMDGLSTFASAYCLMKRAARVDGDGDAGGGIGAAEGDDLLGAIVLIGGAFEERA
jgi:hypothetical protein